MHQTKNNNTLESPIEQPAEQWPERRIIQFRDKFDKCGDCGTFNLWVQQNKHKPPVAVCVQKKIVAYPRNVQIAAFIPQVESLDKDFERGAYVLQDSWSSRGAKTSPEQLKITDNVL